MGGYCFGGLIAQEMARQLMEQGEQVAALVLFDMIPHLYKNLMSADSKEQYDAYASEFKIKRYVHQMKNKTFIERMVYLTGGFIRQVRNHTYLFANTLFKRQEKILSKLFHSVESSNILATNMYTPQPYAGDLILFQSKEIMESCSLTADDWSGLATGKARFHLVSDGGVPNVGNMFKEPTVQRLAEQLNTYLNHSSLPKNNEPHSRSHIFAGSDTSST